MREHAALRLSVAVRGTDTRGVRLPLRVAVHVAVANADGRKVRLHVRLRLRVALLLNETARVSDCDREWVMVRVASAGGEREGVAVKVMDEAGLWVKVRDGHRRMLRDGDGVVVHLQRNVGTRGGGGLRRTPPALRAAPRTSPARQRRARRPSETASLTALISGRGHYLRTPGGWVGGGGCGGVSAPGQPERTHPPGRTIPVPHRRWSAQVRSKCSLCPFEFKCSRLAFGSLLICTPPHEPRNVVMVQEKKDATTQEVP